jgi:hypothetical protein
MYFQSDFGWMSNELILQREHCIQARGVGLTTMPSAVLSVVWL